MVLLQRTEAIGFHSSSIGEEAAIVGASLAARKNDWVFPSVRDWYAALARGMTVDMYVHHAFGSASDPAKGHTSPDHAPARAQNVVPPSGVPGAHLPQGVGAAWAAKIKRENTVAIVLFSDQVMESGDFHNAMNFAGVFKAPVVFVCKSGGSSPRRIPPASERAISYGIASAKVDGSDALAVVTIVRQAVTRAAEGKGATIVEVVMPSFPNLAAALTDDVLQESEPSSELFDLGPDDPLVRLRRTLTREKLDGAMPSEVEAGILQHAHAEIDRAIEAAKRVGPPAGSTIFDHVYASVPAHLDEQRRLQQSSGVTSKKTPNGGSQ
jgi:pyruvate dehydrogenase E1 component alpha subunit